MKKSMTGLLYGNYPHYLDHLAPLCSLVNLPLVVNEPCLCESAKKYYPELDIIYIDSCKIIPSVVKNFTKVITCFPRPLFDAEFGLMQDLLNNRIKTVWLPHGNSDKGRNSPFMEALKNEEALLVYGEKMIDFLGEKNIKTDCTVLGNFRYRYFLKHKLFYQNCIRKELGSFFKPDKKTILFAPTWNDAERSGSFFSTYQELIENLEDFNLIVKLHPNLLIQKEFEIDAIMSSCSNKNNIFFLNHFPPIYPLLELVDIYLGDMSSVGYDFLTFNKPMFFLNPNKRDSLKDKGLFLFRCGKEVLTFKNLSRFIQKALEEDEKFSAIRKQVYDYTFAKDPLNVKEVVLNA